MSTENGGKNTREKSEEMNPKKVFHYQNGELEKTDSPELSKVIGSNGYSKEIVYNSPKKNSINQKNTDDSTSSSDKILDLLPSEESEKPQRVVIYRKKSSFVRLVEGLYDIVTDIIYIVGYSSTHAGAAEKSDKSQMREELWPLLKNVLSKYFTLIKESDLLTGLEDVLPIDKIEKALERGDGRTVWKTLYGSFTPRLLSYAMKMMTEAFLAPLQVFSEQYSQLELRQKADGTINLFEPIKFIAEAALAFFGNHLRDYGPTVARSLSCTFYYDCNEGEGKSLTETYLPYGIAAAGVGGAALSAYYLYSNSVADPQDLDDYNRQKRSVLEDSGLPPTNINEIIDSIDEGDLLVMDAGPVNRVSSKSEYGRKLSTKDVAKKLLMWVLKI